MTDAKKRSDKILKRAEAGCSKLKEAISPRYILLIAEYRLPCPFLVKTLTNENPFFREETYMGKIKHNIWKYFHFDDGKQDRLINLNNGELNRGGHYEEAWGACIHVELDFINDETPTEAQYEVLAKLYYYFHKANYSKKLKIISHLEFDRGIDGAHSDPGINFSFQKLYDLLEKRYSIHIEPGIDGITEERHRASIDNNFEMKQNWPPLLSGAIEDISGGNNRRWK
jgi:hypothetical protein